MYLLADYKREQNSMANIGIVINHWTPYDISNVRVLYNDVACLIWQLSAFMFEFTNCLQNC